MHCPDCRYPLLVNEVPYTCPNCGRQWSELEAAQEQQERRFRTQGLVLTLACIPPIVAFVVLALVRALAS